MMPSPGGGNNLGVGAGNTFAPSSTYNRCHLVL